MTPAIDITHGYQHVEICIVDTMRTECPEVVRWHEVMVPSMTIDSRHVRVALATDTTEVDPNSWESKKAVVHYWICCNPGRDAEDAANELGISHLESVQITKELLQQGLLEHDE